MSPKINNTRKQRAKELVRMLEAGPVITVWGSGTNDKEAEEQVKTWIDFWILPAVYDLVPELRKMKENDEL